VAISRAHEHNVWVRRIERDLAGERVLEVANGCERPATVMADLQPTPGRGIDDIGIERMKARPTLGVGSQLCLVDHPPVVTAVLGDVGGTHVAVEHHQIGIRWGNRGAEHTASAG